jgi:hypothetical protein
LLAETAVGKADAIGLDELGRSCIVIDAVHGLIPLKADKLTHTAPAGRIINTDSAAK